MCVRALFSRISTKLESWKLPSAGIDLVLSWALLPFHPFILLVFFFSLPSSYLANRSKLRRTFTSRQNPGEERTSQANEPLLERGKEGKREARHCLDLYLDILFLYSTLLLNCCCMQANRKKKKKKKTNKSKASVFSHRTLVFLQDCRVSLALFAALAQLSLSARQKG